MGNFGIIVHGGAGKHRDREKAKEGVIRACEVELDAAIMIGNDYRFGGVGGIKGFKNPILIARRVLEKTPHVLLVGSGV